MAASFFFYDLETSGFSPREARIMQFAGQRTDMDLQPLGEPVNVLIKLNPDVLPDPDAVLLTGITPQSTLQDGLSEAEFLSYFYETVIKPDTTFVGYNSIRFDDEFMRFLHYRNFYDPYEWQWQHGCSRWDILDLVRMTRALRPEGIAWPVTAEGKPTNRLELLTKANKLDHSHAHDALSDVYATIAIAKLIHDNQPDLFSYLLKVRSKKAVSELLAKASPIIYTSGRYPSSVLHTTAVVLLSKHPQQDAALVYDLRYDPSPFVSMSVDELVACWRYNPDPNAVRLPLKTIKYNRCPAVAPLGVISDPATQERLDLPIATIERHLKSLTAHRAAFSANVLAALKQLDAIQRSEQAKESSLRDIDGQLYEGFFEADDKTAMQLIRASRPSDLAELSDKLHDKRLQGLLPRYIARNYPEALNADERAIWDSYVSQKLFGGGKLSRLAKYFGRLQELAAGSLTQQQEFLIEELQLYGESVMPSEVSEEST